MKRARLSDLWDVDMRHFETPRVSGLPFGYFRTWKDWFDVGDVALVLLVLLVLLVVLL